MSPATKPVAAVHACQQMKNFLKFFSFCSFGLRGLLAWVVPSLSSLISSGFCDRPPFEFIKQKKITTSTMAIALSTRQNSFLFLFAAIVNGFQSPAPQLHSRVVRCMTSSVIDGDDGSTRGMETPFFASVSDAKDDKSEEKDSIVDWDWETMANAVFVDDKRPIVLFDGVCNLCDAGINFAMDQDESARFRFCSLQSKVAQSLLLRSGKAADDTSNIVLITEDDAFFSSDAVSRICMGLDAQPLQWFGHLGQYTPPWIRESLYLFVSKNRYKFGENDSCRLDFDGTYTSRFVSDPTNQDGDGI